MGIDINLFRPEKGGDPEIVRTSELNRCRDGTIVSSIVDVDNQWRQAVFNMEQSKKECNAVSKEIGTRKKKGEDCDELMQRSLQLKQDIPELEKKVVDYATKRESLLAKVGNLLHPSVVVSDKEENNRVTRTWGTFPELPFQLLSHHDIMTRLDGFERQNAVKIAGHRGYFLKGSACMLNMALIQYGVNFLVKKGYIPIQPPLFMRREVMAHTAELKDFEETLYRIPVDEGKDPRDDLFLVATSEQPISALHMSHRFLDKQLPLRYAGVSSCFRKEAGAHGKDTWGLFRVHQFEKVEQFCVTTPETSCAMHEEMIQTAQEFYESLQLPYRVVSIVSGALNDAAAKKYDLEAWFPGYDGYRELVSCSNCTDYQSRSLDIRLGYAEPGGTEKRFVHMLNGTLVASERCLCCILENYQTNSGVRVPRALLPYMGGVEFLPWITP